MQFSDVGTFIESGNVVFTSTQKNSDNLTRKVEKILSEKFNNNSRAVIITKQQLKKIIESAPKGFGRELLKYRYDVAF